MKSPAHSPTNYRFWQLQGPVLSCYRNEDDPARGREPTITVDLRSYTAIKTCARTRLAGHDTSPYHSAQSHVLLYMRQQLPSDDTPPPPPPPPIPLPPLLSCPPPRPRVTFRQSRRQLPADDRAAAAEGAQREAWRRRMFPGPGTTEEWWW